ncbi:low molecular weight protein-tyrosine-phosphatase [Polymorphum gilvum]|nr:low molecular weight protein-tyrosine-phosphatase [Polymorphum gilvum]
MTAVLFVCLGNICRSPLAEGVFRHVAGQTLPGARLTIDSAGTGAWHVGNPPDPRSIAVARRHGIDISDLRARQVTRADFERFDLILAMDGDNLDALRRAAPHATRAEIRRFLAAPPRDVPDPYHGGPDRFAAVYRLIEEGARDLATRLARIAV